ncbi:MAG: hypothetical protein ABR874_23490 [Candidatus Sulfotelmatobacter sp.]
MKIRTINEEENEDMDNLVRTLIDNPAQTADTSARDKLDRQRLQLDFTQEGYNRLLQVKELADARSNAEVVRNALRVYEWFLRQKKDNYRLQLVRDDRVRDVELVL